MFEFVQRAGGGGPGSSLREVARVLHGLTGGNPFLMTELWRSVLEADPAAMAPARTSRPGGRQPRQPGRRAGGRQPAAGATQSWHPRLLELAAVAGAEFDLESSGVTGRRTLRSGSRSSRRLRTG